MLGVMANMTLRQPEAVERCAQVCALEPLCDLCRKKRASDAVRQGVACGLGSQATLSGGPWARLRLAIKTCSIVCSIKTCSMLAAKKPCPHVRCVQAGVVEWVLETQAALPAAGPVQRSAAILTRNMVVRNPELRPVFLEKGERWRSGCEQRRGVVIHLSGMASTLRPRLHGT